MIKANAHYFKDMPVDEEEGQQAKHIIELIKKIWRRGNRWSVSLRIAMHIYD